MKRILVTGVSGVGKSTVIAELAARGYKAIDADCDEYSQWAVVASASDELGSPVEEGRDWVWREDRIRDLLAAEDADVLFLGGCAENMRAFLPQFDQIVLLSAPAGVIAARLGSRTTNPYGKRPEEVARVLDQLRTVEPLLRRAADVEMDASAPLGDVVGWLVRLAQA